MRKYIAIALAGLLSLPAVVRAQLTISDTGLETTAGEAYGTSSDVTVGGWIGEKIITPALSLVGVIFLVLMIYAGFLWMTAGGNPDQTKKAKDIMIRAVIGIVIIVASYAITTFIFGAVA